MRSVLLLISLFFIVACQNDSTNSQFTLLQQEETGIDFSNNLPIDLDLNILNYMYYYNGGGTALGDLNNDGLIDIVFSSNIENEAVYLNKGDLQFENITNQVKIDGGPNSWTNGVALADIDGNGWLDIYLSQVGTYRNLDCKNKLFMGYGLDDNGIPQFKEEAEERGVDFKGFSTHAGFFDYDLDGDLDMYLMNHSLHHNGTFGQREDFLYKVHPESGDKLFRNDNGKFTDVTEESGIYSNVIGYGLGLAFGDINNDGYPDIYVGNDFHENDYLYINQKDGTFKEELTQNIKHTSRFSMGVDIADINNDNLLDIVSLDMLPEDPYILKTSEGEDALDIFNFKLDYGYNHQYAKNALQLNQGDNTFKEIGVYSGVHATDWSWSALFFDMDLDGIKDLFISNGIPKRMNDIDYINFISGNDIQYKIQFDELEKQDLSVLEKIPEIKLMNKFYKGNSQLKFQDLKSQITQNEISYSNSAAYADLDNDGDYDIVSNNIDQNAFIYRNDLNPESYIKINFKGDSLNRNGIGVSLIAEKEDETQLRFERYSTKGFQASVVDDIIIPTSDLKFIEVIWPSSKSERIQYSGQTEYTFEIENATLESGLISAAYTTQALTDYTEQSGISFMHEENPFVEFNREPLLPFSTAVDGPALAVGDVNGDNLEDIYIGSSKRRKSAFYLQNTDGTFSEKKLIGLETDSIYEETAAIFIDIDNDNDLDLVVATGGNEYRLNSPYTLPLLYENQDGSLVRNDNVFKGIHGTFSTVVSSDINKDGLQDLFFGGRAVPWNYGETPQSFLLINKGNLQFEDQTTKWHTELANAGFVRDAKFDDINNDGTDDLVIANEWGKVVSYINIGEQFEYQAIGKETGLWNCVNVADLNNDGLLDIFAGNLGLNSRLKNTENQNIKLYYNDFDDNGVKEQLLSYSVDGKEIPFSNMMELQKQIPVLKKKYLYAKDFASSSIQELASKDKINASRILEAEELASCIYFQNASGGFDKEILPYTSQFSSIVTAHLSDIDEDGDIDIIPGKNFHHCNVQMGRYDADNGSVIYNNGAGTFELKNIKGKPLQEQVRNIKSIILSDGSKAFVFAQNDGPLKILKVN